MPADLLFLISPIHTPLTWIRPLDPLYIYIDLQPLSLPRLVTGLSEGCRVPTWVFASPPSLCLSFGIVACGMWISTCFFWFVAAIFILVLGGEQWRLIFLHFLHFWGVVWSDLRLVCVGGSMVIQRRQGLQDARVYVLLFYLVLGSILFWLWRYISLCFALSCNWVSACVHLLCW